MSRTAWGTTTDPNALLSEHEFLGLLSSLKAPRVQATKLESEPRGRGHYAVVYKGTMLVQSSRIAVALKVFHRKNTRAELERLTKNIVRETRVWIGLEHPNVLPLLGVCPDIESRRIWLISPWMDNGNLSEYLRHNTRADCVGLCRGIARGVDYLHSVNVLHEDIRATNVLVDARGEPLLADFGLSRFTEELPPAGDATTGLYQGSLRWMAPERVQPATFGLAAGAAQSTASDVYSVGMTMYEIFTRRAPFDNKRDLDIIQMLVRGVRLDHPGHDAIIRGMNPRLWEFMWDTWDFDRTKRPRLDVALQTVLFDPASAPPTTSPLSGVTKNSYTRKNWLEIDLVPSEPVYDLENWSSGYYLGRTSRGEKGVFPGYLIHLADQSTAHGVPHEPRVPDAPGIRPRPVQRATQQTQPDPITVARVNVPVPRTVSMPAAVGQPAPSHEYTTGQYYQEPSEYNARAAPHSYEQRSRNMAPGFDPRLVHQQQQSHAYSTYPSHVDESDDEETDNEGQYSSSSGGHLSAGHGQAPYGTNLSHPTAPLGYYAPPPYPPNTDARTQYRQGGVPLQQQNPDPRMQPSQDARARPPPQEPRSRQPQSASSGYVNRPAPLTAINQVPNAPPKPNLPTPPLSAGYQITAGGPPNYPYANRSPPPAEARGQPPTAAYHATTHSAPPGPPYQAMNPVNPRSDTMPPSAAPVQYPARPTLQGQGHGRPGSFPPTHAPPPPVGMPQVPVHRPQPVPPGHRQLPNPLRQQQPPDADRDVDAVTGYMGSMSIQQPPARPGQQPGQAYWPPPQR